MSAKHTPGPWVESTTMHGVGNIKCFGVEDREGRPVANCGQWRDGEANARLIAAAPELLEALETILYLYESLAESCLGLPLTIEQMMDLPDHQHDATLFARDTIAKAKGE